MDKADLMPQVIPVAYDERYVGIDWGRPFRAFALGGGWSWGVAPGWIWGRAFGALILRTRWR